MEAPANLRLSSSPLGGCISGFAAPTTTAHPFIVG
jgi:hypothetical protein